ncbi:uncharacterized protein LOC116295857 [Actinia tenebrosa]|uniref:Uncharacterized protein LOC116295857 n=1 Tax=Actinia tenebrosa TaxID=6105 RepID=A0A6P8HWC2_ACTTE|nr:uncharacterized protein LOC116295857 [Actinia tenebrosa]
MNLEKAFLLLLCLFVIEISSVPRHEDDVLDDILPKSPSLETKKTEALIDSLWNSRHARRGLDKTRFTLRDVLLKNRMSPRVPEVRQIEEKPHARAYFKDLLTAGNFVDKELKPMNLTKKQYSDPGNPCVDKRFALWLTANYVIPVVSCHYHITNGCAESIPKYSTRLCEPVVHTMMGRVFATDCKCKV